jgi:Rrf2 family protein
MFVTPRTYHAIEILSELSKADKPLSVKHFAEEMEVSVSYLEYIFQGLKKYDLVASVRGPYGGYHLKKSLSKIRFIDVRDAAEWDNEDIVDKKLAAKASNVMNKQLASVTIETMLNTGPAKQRSRSPRGSRKIA